ncbi:nuclear transport factor 2 family protein [Sandaracinobacteroides saxicola]|uniref:Ester cyclase n=1 Tax=Sandaracinobacteroides saxicola TaxID=2759707 RepID=A0A7G5IEX2_9SPHN|nr:ester cyclase [Sandaracinobacteroides saxicola]QMW21914.1 ester cyclase [Sandaracinobacteroides saxicola]
MTKADFLARLHSAAPGALLDISADHATLHGCRPIETLNGPAAMAAGLYAPLAAALADLERRPAILLSGTFRDGEWFAHSGAFVGRFVMPLWGLAPSNRPHWLRYGQFDRLEQGRIVETYLILDLPRLMIETGQWPLRPPPGEEWFPAPAPQDGLDPDVRDGAQSLALVESMIAGLMRFDGQNLASMGMRDFWTPHFHWYGPGPIGSARGHEHYEATHQRPFLTAFPDRVGGNHKCRIGDGGYVASTGWPSINATHRGDGWLGQAATHRRITMRVMDFWRRDAGLLAENWVFIDIPDLLAQFGTDLGLKA